MKERATYQLIRDGGRVKSAGVSIDFVVKQGELFKENSGSDTAVQITKTFSALRENPPLPIRNRFFPQDRAEVKAQTKKSPALYRPVLKNDQGAGKFLPFEIGGNGKLDLPFRVKLEEGYIIPEVYFDEQLEERGSPETVVLELEAVRGHFEQGDLNEARLAFERLEIESEKAGIVFRRRVGVGRNGLMFIHPAKTEKQILLSNELAAEIEYEVNSHCEELITIAETRKRLFAKEYNLPTRLIDEFGIPLYFQSDVHLFPNGSFVLAEMQMPDVGLFLNGLPANGSDVFKQVHKIMDPMQKKIINGFEQTIQKAESEKGKMPIYLVTRSGVVYNKEDVLEIRELAQVQTELKKRGYNSEVISTQSASELDTQCLMFLFNLDPLSEEFGKLAKSYLADTKRKLLMVPDPFLRVAEREMTGYQQVQMSDRQLGNLIDLVKEMDSPNDKKEKVYIQLMAIDYFLRQLDIEEDILHFCHPALPTPVPCYRYDIRSLQIAANIIKEGNLQNIKIRSIPISLDRGVLLDNDGGTLYTTFRFMFLRKD